MPSKSKKAPSVMEARKIGRKLDPDTSWGDVIKRPFETPHVSNRFQAPESGIKPSADLLLQRKDGRGSIGQAIRFMRKEKGISQEELATKARVDRTTVARIECGIFKSLSVEKLEGIAIAIGIDLKTLFLKADSMGESMSYRGHLSRIEFTLEYPQEGFRIVSHFPKQKEFFFGRVEVQPQKTIASKNLPHPQQIYLHSLEGRLLLTLDQREFLLKPGDCYAFIGLRDYEFYNPDQLEPTSSLFITYPSFLFV